MDERFRMNKKLRERSNRAYEKNRVRAFLPLAYRRERNLNKLGLEMLISSSSSR